MMATKGCWTCKDRKVACDRNVPKCLKCTKSKRECTGYGLRLTWPQEDKNRAVVLHTTSEQNSLYWDGPAYQWINVVPTDICLQIASSTSTNKGKSMSRHQLSFPKTPEPIQRNLSYAATNDLELLRYFESVVIHMLPMMSSDRARLCDLLLRTALSSQNNASTAVYHAILALSSYHQGGDLLYVDQLKRNALRELRTDTVPSECEGLGHIAANLLLCVLEMQQTAGNNSGWVGYISGVKQVIDAVKKAELPKGGDASLILGWVYYFDVMARFTFRHWRTEYVEGIAKALGFNPCSEYTCKLHFLLARASFARSIPNMTRYAHQIVGLLAEISDTAIQSSDPRYLTREYQDYLNDLRARLEDVSPRIHSVDSSIQAALDHDEQLLEIGRLAGLIYLERVSRNFSGQSDVVEAWTRQALIILAQLDTCLFPFALWIVGCEADKDADRRIILDIFAKMEARPHFQSFMEVRSLIQTAWNLQDLTVNGELEYIQKLNIVLSSRWVYPSLI